MTIEKATFGAGCFWGVEEAFRNVNGVAGTQVGYTGGVIDDPEYKQVCSGKTGHAEVVEVTFDTEIIAYAQLLDIFWNLHDPTTLNRQGPDVGSQYRSMIFTHSLEQKEAAKLSKASAQKQFKKPIVTQILPAPAFWPAEEYHQKYLLKRGYGVCRS
ncbi:MAG: peptide-methionine (S)-S-oxide reductase MsrA [Alphaproteobacteria bacterium]|nr:peptide-methionine (S)-S-oxide reductase MsrA [Alphaproteobacteria bacterium]